MQGNSGSVPEIPMSSRAQVIGDYCGNIEVGDEARYPTVIKDNTCGTIGLDRNGIRIVHMDDGSIIEADLQRLKRSPIHQFQHLSCVHRAPLECANQL